MEIITSYSLWDVYYMKLCEGFSGWDTVGWTMTFDDGTGITLEIRNFYEAI